MKITELEISKIRPYERNQKKHPQSQIDNVAESIKQFGWQQPIVLDKNNVIIIGHCRYLASLKLGIDKVPVTYAENLKDEQVKKLRIVDNKTNESDWLVEELTASLGELDFTGFEFNWGGLLNNTEISDETEFLEQKEPDLDKNNRKTCTCPQCGLEFDIYE